MILAAAILLLRLLLVRFRLRASSERVPSVDECPPQTEEASAVEAAGSTRRTGTRATGREMDNGKRTVVVTGFEPFGEHTVNASWVAVQELKKLGLGGEVDLHVSEVPVEYQRVQSLVPTLLKKHHPLLVVHVGVSGMATTVTLEKCGRNHGYKGLDNSSFCPDSQCCIVGGPDCINSVIDMESVCKRVTASGLGVAVSVSKDAGSRGRSAFVHVPPLGKPYSGEDLGRALQAIIHKMLELLDQKEEKIHCQKHFH
ncbi:Pyroglutamyl-peptidase 1 [Liparis tanakae]|uniref:Pyroglutamyl-peptidase I n=1 Tax=Liparis tanakae TaxID=230148 RepID=A0A4Z2FNJ9_9TELE|nr:Pyroglutamyl-peptidase 1 [Liparis tanakae]